MKKSNKVILIAVLIIIIATLTSCIGIYFVNKNKDTDPNSIPNIDKLESPKEDYVRVLACGVDKSQKLTDVIMYAVYDVKNQSINVLQIPRDSFIGTDYVSGKINSVYGSKKEPKDSMKELEKILEEQFKLQVDYTASITLEGVSNIVDSLGGVKMNVPMTLNYLPGKVIYEGEQIIDGEKAEWLVRFRSGYKNADIGRLNMQKEFLMAMLDTVKDKGRIAAVSALAANFGELKTNMPLTKAMSLANKAFAIEKENINMFTLDGNGKMYGTYAVYELDKEKTADLLNQHFRLDGDEVSAQELGLMEVPYIEVPEKEQLLDELGRPIDEYGFLIDEDGNPIDENGNYIIFKDDNGIICDKFGNPVDVDENGYPIYNKGNNSNSENEAEFDADEEFQGEDGLLDENGNIISETDTDASNLDENGNIISETGTDGSNLDENGNIISNDESEVYEQN